MSESEDTSSSREVWFAPYLDERRPWLSRFSLPLKEEEVRHAYRTEKDEVRCSSREALRDAIREKQDRVWAVAVPEYPRWIPPFLLFPPDPRSVRFQPGDLLRPLVVTILLGVIYAATWEAMRGRSGSLGDLGRSLGFHPFLVLFFLMFFGVMPLSDALFRWWESRKIKRPEDSLRGFAEHVLFGSWVRRTPKWVSLVGPFVLAALFLVQLYVGGGVESSALRAGMLRWAVEQGEWWRLLTAGFLHGGWLHLGFNGYALYHLGRVLVALAHPCLLAIVFLLSVLGGSYASFAFSNAPLSVGSSGGILGLLGFLVGLEFFRKAGLPTAIRSNLIQAILMISLFGFLGAAMIDNAAHAGGFVVGLALSLILFPRKAEIGAYDPPKPVLWLGWASLVILVLGVGQVVVELQKGGAYGIEF